MINLNYIRTLSAEDLATLLLNKEEILVYGYSNEYEHSHTETSYVTSDNRKFNNYISAIEHEIKWLNTNNEVLDD